MKHLLLLICLIFTSLSFAQEGPYSKRLSKATVAQKIVNLIDNSSVGAIQTTLGASHIIMYAVLNPISGNGFVKMETHNDEKSEVSQIVIDEDIPWFSGAYSLGLFQVGGAYHDHEGGHAVASGSLGPLYLPAVGLSYLFEGHGSSLFEDWADLEARATDYSLTGDIQVGYASIDQGGEKRNAIVFKASIDQTQFNEGYDIESHKTLSWLNTTIMKPMVNKMNNGSAPPILFEVDVLRKKIDVIADNLAIYLGGDSEIRTVIKTDQRYLSLSRDVLQERVHLKLMDWSAEFGFEYNLEDIVKITPHAGLTASAGFWTDKGASRDFLRDEKFDFTANAGIKAGLDIKVLDYVTWENEWAKNWYLNGMVHKSFYSGVSNERRNPNKDFGFIHSIELSAGLMSETLQVPTEYGLDKINSSYLQVGVGIRF